MKSTSLADGPRGEVGAVYPYVSKAMGTTIRGIGRLMEPLITFMGRRLNMEHLEALRRELEKV